MKASYPATYNDAHGREETILTNDGETLRMALRGVTFSAADFDGFEPEDNTPPEDLAVFKLNGRELCSCMLDFEMPVPIHDKGQNVSGTLAISLTLGKPKTNGAISHIHLCITLTYQDLKVIGNAKTGHFEDELNRIQGRLPEGVYIKACINCLYSDYSPFGSDLFGTMMCFRNVKEDYLAVTSKETFWPVHDRADRQVQETYLCGDFARRTPNTGYRG